jgi:hypothetical protein
MKWLAIFLVGAVALYAIYELFINNAGLGAIGTTPGQITPSGQSVAGVPTYANVASPSNSQLLSASSITALAAATLPVSASDAFGPGNDLSDDEIDDSDATSLVTGDSTTGLIGS